MRFGLCCLFMNEPITFRTTTATALAKLSRQTQLQKLSDICYHNVENLHKSLKTVKRLHIGAFRIMSPLFPRMTHPEVGYELENLPDGAKIVQTLKTIKNFSHDNDIRLSFHPDQFVVLSSPHPNVVENSIRELLYQTMLAESVGADVINIHAGGVYGDKKQALERFATAYKNLPEQVKSRLTIENDDVSYTPTDLLPLCQKLSIPLVYDVHHHRCNRDNLTIQEATELAATTWQKVGREQYCHISSPKNGWNSANPKPHADFIDPGDMPENWLDKNMTVDIEAKSKELAVLQIMYSLL